VSVGTTFSETADLLRRNVFALVAIGAIVFVPLDLVAAAADDTRGWGDTSAGRFAVFLLVLLVGQTLAYGAAIAAIAVEPEGADEEARTPFAALRDATMRWPTLLAITIVGGVAVLIGLVLVIVPGLLFLTWWFVAFQPAMIEGSGWRASLGRSRALVRGSFWQVLVVAILTLAFVGAVDYALYRVAAAALSDFVAAWTAGVVADTLAIAVLAAVTTATYWQLSASRPSTTASGAGPI
jgi:hypothetical protein